MTRILVTDAVGLVGAYIIRSLLGFPGFQAVHEAGSKAENTILAGYHSSEELEVARKENAVPTVIQPILVDWAVPDTYYDAVRTADSVLLLTPFTSKKVSQVEEWISAITNTSETHALEGLDTGDRQRRVHIVHIGIHTDDSPAAKDDRPAHETWQLEAEAHIRNICTETPRLSWTFLRINFDGYNTLLRPGRVAYYIPKTVPFGWMAREDIASFAAQTLVDARHKSKTYTLSAEAISLEDMATAATRVMGFPIEAVELNVQEFERMALAAPGDEGYREYIRSVVRLFEELQLGYYPWHKQVFPDIFEKVLGRKPMSFADWLEGSPMKARLEKGTKKD